MNCCSALILAALAVVITIPAEAQDPVKLSPRMYKVLLENEHVRVLEFRAKPGESEPMHAHPAATVYSMSGGRLKLTTVDGKSSIIEGKAGSAVWSPPTVHRYENIGSTESHEIIVEIKNARPAATPPAKRPNRP
jgi:beta-alanine degradation protein BauB